MLERVELTVEAACDLDGVGAGLFLHTHNDGRLAVARAFAALERSAFPNIRHISHEHRPIAPQGDHGFADLFRCPCAADGFEHVLLRAFCVHTGRCVLTRPADRGQQLRERDVVGAQRIGMRNDLELSLRPADRRDLRDAGHGQQPPPHRRIGDRAKRERIVAV